MTFRYHQLESITRISAALLVAGFCFGVTIARSDDLQMSDLVNKSLEELSQVRITIASKKPEPASNTAAATFVITQEDIRRSGYTTIPEILRMVPGVNVLRIDNSQWAVSIRGFSAVFADKLLVLIDGRTIYTPLFGGVFWNEQDTMIEDIERIEVIRGPGAALWGANATNGVINIVTKRAENTKGMLAAGNLGTEERAGGAVRLGKSDGDLNYRVYAKTFYRDGNDLVDAGSGHDDWSESRAGFRTDTELSERSTLTVQGDGYYGESGWDSVQPSLSSFVEEEEIVRYHDGANLLGRYTRSIDEATLLQVQSYYDHVDRNDRLLLQSRDTFDVDSQLQFSPLTGHDLIAGIGYRIWQDRMDGSFEVSVSPGERTDQQFAGFLQDEIGLIDRRWRAIAGAKLEHHEYSGFAFQPSARTIYDFEDGQTVWMAVSRAARTPARFNQDGKLTLSAFPIAQQTAAVTLSGSRDFDSEILTAYEAGGRSRLSRSLAVDLAFFYNDYDSLESAEPFGLPFPAQDDGAGYIEVPLHVENRLVGHSIGGEFSGIWQVLPAWRIMTGYSYLDLSLTPEMESHDTIFTGQEGQTPKNQFFVRSTSNLSPSLEFNGDLRFMSSAPTFDVDKYAEVNLNLIWHATPKIEVALVGQNLIHPDHVEFASNLVDTHRTAIERGAYLKVTLRQ
jgi:iron complex outermembrane receptor protein